MMIINYLYFVLIFDSIKFENAQLIVKIILTFLNVQNITKFTIFF